MKKKGTGNARLAWHFLRGSKWAFALGVTSMLVVTFTGMVSPQIIRIALDNVIMGQPTDSLSSFATTFLSALGGAAYLKDNLWILALVLLGVALVAFVAQYLFRVMNTLGAETFTKNIRDELYGRISHLPFSWHMRNHTGDIIQRCTSDVETLKTFSSEQLTGIVRIVVMAVMSISFMYSMHWQLATIAVSLMPLVVLYSLLFHKHIKKSFTECDEKEGEVSNLVQENLTGVRVVRAFGREGYEREKFEKHNAEYTGLYVRLARIMARFWASLDVITGLELMIVIVAGAVYAVQGGITVGEYIAFMSYNGMLVWPVRMLGRLLAEMSKAGVALGRIGYVVNSEPEKDAVDAVETNMAGDVTFEHVNFAYDNCPELLHDVTFSVKAGTTVGIMGGTGSGKSTLMLLLDKLYDLEDPASRITIGGVDIRKVKTDYLRAHIGIVLQEPYLFSRTLRENIGIKHEGITLESIREAAAAARLDETIDAFPQGYDTQVGERGVTLSGGQKQRAAIARVLTDDAPILIFDDSLSAVDTETDAIIRANLERRFGTATIFLISHRVSTLRKADLIVVLEKGRICEMGTHNQLVQADGLYRSIYQAQTAGVDEL